MHPVRRLAAAKAGSVDNFAVPRGFPQSRAPRAENVGCPTKLEACRSESPLMAPRPRATSRLMRPPARSSVMSAALGLSAVDAFVKQRALADAMALEGALADGDIISVVTAGRGSTPDPTKAVLSIHVVGGPDSGLVWSLPRGRLILGREPNCDLRLRDPDVSRRHAAVEVSGGAITVTDLGSTNGCTIDEAALATDRTRGRRDTCCGSDLRCYFSSTPASAQRRFGAKAVRGS
jgi:hypothetical protein